MNLREDFELLESLFVELDPLTDGFAGVLLELYRCKDRYVLLETAPHHRRSATQVLVDGQGAGLCLSGSGARRFCLGNVAGDP